MSIQELQKIDDALSKKINTNEVAGRIIQGLRLISTPGGFFAYGDGYYQKIDKSVVIQMIYDNLRKNFSIKMRNEIIASIEAQKHIPLEELYKSPVLNLKNGLFNTDTCTLSPHTPDIYSTARLPVNYDPSAQCPTWLKAIEEIMSSDQEKIRSIRQYFGLCLTRETKFNKALFMLGEGANGKGTVLKVLSEIVGKNNRSSITVSQLSKPCYVSALFNKIVNISYETLSKSDISDDIFKAITSGDNITADAKYRDPLEFTPYCKMIFATNNMPRVDDKTNAYYRRLLVIRFEKEFGGADDDKNILNKLLLELDGIFLWCLEGLRDLNESGELHVPSSSKAEIDEYRKENNNVIAFMEDKYKITSNQSAYVSKEELYKEYRQWCIDFGYKPGSIDMFGKQIKKRFKLNEGYKKYDRKSHRVWFGIESTHQIEWDE
jgi:putative DNA primase/helicase